MAELLNADEIFYTAFEPKHQHRFIMYIEGVPAYTIKAANRPTVAFNPITIDHMNVNRKVKGKANWEDITITLYDPVVPSAAQSAMEWIRRSHESVTGRDGYSDFYKKDITINVLGPVGDKVEEWTLKGAFINNASFGSLDWSTDDLINIELTLSYDYAILQY